MTLSMPFHQVKDDIFAAPARSKAAQCRRAYLRSIITRIEVSKEKIRIIGDTNVLAGAVSGRKDGPQNVRGYVRNWRALQESNLWPQD